MNLLLYPFRSVSNQSAALLPHDRYSLHSTGPIVPVRAVRIRLGRAPRRRRVLPQTPTPRFAVLSVAVRASSRARVAGFVSLASLLTSRL